MNNTPQMEQFAIQPIFFTRENAATMLSLSIRTLDKLILNGELAVKRVGRKILVSSSELKQFSRRDHATQRTRLNGSGR